MPHPFLVFVKAVVERFKSVALGRRRIGLSFFILTGETNGLLKRGTATTFTESKGETALIHVSHPSVMRQKEGVSDHGGSFMYSVHTLLVFPSPAAASWPRFFAAADAVEDFLRTVLLHATNHQVFAPRLTEQAAAVAAAFAIADAEWIVGGNVEVSC